MRHPPNETFFRETIRKLMRNIFEKREADTELFILAEVV